MNLSDGWDRPGISLYEGNRLNLPTSSNKKEFQNLAGFHGYGVFQRHDLLNATKSMVPYFER